MIKVELWECEHCKKHHTQTSGGMAKHENKCFWNPETKSCMTCLNFIGGGHYQNTCEYEQMNDNCGDRINRKIKKLQTNCPLYEYSGLPIDDQKREWRELDDDANYDNECYDACRM